MATPLVSYDIPTDREDLDDVLSVLAQRDMPFTSMIMDGGLAATNTKHEWVDSNLTGFVDQLNGAITSGATSIDVDGSYQGVSVKYVVGTLLLIDDEVVRVTAVAGNTLTVTRGFASTSAAAHNDDSRVEIISKPKDEGWTPTEDESEFGAKAYNHTQIFGRYISMTGTAQAITVVGNENDINMQLQRKMKEIMKEMERACINGLRVEDSGNARRTLGGLRQYVPAGNVDNALGAALDLERIDALVRKSLEIGAEPDVLLVSNIQKAKLNNLKQARVTGNMAQSERRLNNLVDVYESEAGPLTIVRSNDVLPGDVWLLEKGRFKVVPLQSRRLAIKKLSTTGDKDNAMIVGEYTMQARNPEVLFRIKNLATA